MTMSHSLAALWAMNRRRPSAVVADDPSKHFGGGIPLLGFAPDLFDDVVGHDDPRLAHHPSRRSSIAAISMVPVLPAPTTWSSSVEGSLMIRATALRW